VDTRPLAALLRHRALLAAPDVWVAAVSDGNGLASWTLSLPYTPVLRGLNLAAQTASATATNAFGFATSDALELRCR
jgi:hypothetical protein